MIVQPHNPDRAAKAQVQLDKASQILNMNAEQERAEGEALSIILGKKQYATNTVTTGDNR